MKSPGGDIVVMAVVWLTYASLVLGSYDAQCTFNGKHIEIVNAIMSDLTIEIPSNCSGYTYVWIRHSTIGSVNVNAFQKIQKPGTELVFEFNQKMTGKHINFNADFRNTGITKVKIHHNDKIKLGTSLELHENTTEIYMNGNNITDLPSGIFMNLKKLKILELYDNSLTCLDSDTFHGLDNLEKLYLNENNLKKLKPGTFKNLPQLQTLHLHHNKLETIRPDQFTFRGDKSLGILPKIDVQNNPLRNLQRCLADIGSFKYTNHSNLTLIGNSDPPGTIEKNICMNVEKANTTVQFHTTTLAQESQTIERPGGSTPHVKPTVPQEEEREIHLFFFWGVFVVSALIFLLCSIAYSKRVALRHIRSARLRIRRMSSFEMIEMEEQDANPGVIDELNDEGAERPKKIQPETHLNQKPKKSVQSPQVAARNTVAISKGKKGITPRGSKRVNPHAIAPASRNISRRTSTQVRRATLLGRQTIKNQK